MSVRNKYRLPSDEKHQQRPDAVRDFLASGGNEELTETFEDLQNTLMAMKKMDAQHEFDMETLRKVREYEEKGFYQEEPVSATTSKFSTKDQATEESSESEYEPEFEPKPLSLPKKRTAAIATAPTTRSKFKPVPLLDDSSSRSSIEKSGSSVYDFGSPETQSSSFGAGISPRDTHTSFGSFANRPSTGSIPEKKPLFPPRRSSLEAREHVVQANANSPVSPSERVWHDMTDEAERAQPSDTKPRELKRTASASNHNFFHSNLGATRPLPRFAEETSNTMLDRSSTVAGLGDAKPWNRNQGSTSSNAPSHYAKVWSPPVYDPAKVRTQPRSSVDSGKIIPEFEHLQDKFDLFQDDKAGIHRSSSVMSVVPPVPPLPSTMPKQKSTMWFEDDETPKKKQDSAPAPFLTKRKSFLQKARSKVDLRVVIPQSSGNAPQQQKMSRFSTRSQPQLTPQPEETVRPLNYRKVTPKDISRPVDLEEFPIPPPPTAPTLKHQSSLRRMASAASGLHRRFSLIGHKRHNSIESSISTNSSAWITTNTDGSLSPTYESPLATTYESSPLPPTYEHQPYEHPAHEPLREWPIVDPNGLLGPQRRSKNLMHSASTSSLRGSVYRIPQRMPSTPNLTHPASRSRSSHAPPLPLPRSHTTTTHAPSPLRPPQPASPPPILEHPSTTNPTATTSKKDYLSRSALDMERANPKAEKFFGGFDKWPKLEAKLRKRERRKEVKRRFDGFLEGASRVLDIG